MIAISQFDDGGSVMRTDRWPRPVHLGPHEDARYVAVSPDGRRVATGSHAWDGCKIWDMQSRWDAPSAKFEIKLPIDNSTVGFSPDGRWLATTGAGLRLWSVGSWKPGPAIGGFAFAFSPDGGLLAVETNSGVIRLVDPNTGHEYCRLEDPNQDRARYIDFSPDGTRLIATNDDSQCVHVWDLRIIREQLTGLHLDWNLPPYPPRTPEDPTPLEVQVNTLAIRFDG
ncbi:MAG: repeat protein [Phycisphaerales bacterium]|nr:repeat protein [Phycisphaerales bacterium]